MSDAERGDDGSSSMPKVLSSLKYLDQVRLSNATITSGIVRPEGSNVDVFQLPSSDGSGSGLTASDAGITTDGETIVLCHLAGVLPFTQGNYVPVQTAYDDAASIALAAHHMNIGDGSVVPELQGFHERCPNIKFTTEFMDTGYSPGIGLQDAVDFMYREDFSQRKPCAFIGAYRSAVSMPMSIVTGLFNYPQISAASTSADLDDKLQYPLFGRTVPSDSGTAIPIIIYFNELGVDHLAVINVNDAYGNAYVDGLRQAAAIHAPNMTINQIPLDEKAGSIPTAISSLKQSKFRYVFAIVFTGETHDALLTEAYKKGVAGTGYHNWFFGDSFLGVLDGRTFPANSTLAKVYSGVGVMQVTGGVAGIPSYDAFYEGMGEMKNSADLEYIGSLFPKHPDQAEVYSPDGRPPFIDSPSYLTLINDFSPLHYEAAVLIGLSACQALKQASFGNSTTWILDGKEHYEQMLQTRFTGISGEVILNNLTGTRDPNTALYSLTNYKPFDIIDPENGQSMVEFKINLASLFSDMVWTVREPYIFNDGTSNVQPDLPTETEVGQDSGASIGMIVGLSLAGVFIIALFAFLIYERKRKKEDAVWHVKKEELVFAEPPEVIGRGTFGMVLLAEYRGTQVAVKRVIPPEKKVRKGKSKNSSMDTSGNSLGYSSGLSTSAYSYASGSSAPIPEIAVVQDENFGMKSGNASGVAYRSAGQVTWGGISLAGFVSGAANATTRSPTMNRKRLEKEFIEEMRYLSKLRHPCVTTVMGAVIGRGEEPMLVMEYMEHGSLYDILHNVSMVVTGELILPILQDISQGMRFLHSAAPPVIHGDLKAANILVDNRFRAKVADFGLSQKKNVGGTGTPFWMAPELLRGESTNTLATDVYSFGIILYEVYSRKDPYEGEDPRQVLRAVKDTSINKRPPVPQNAPAQMQSLMVDCLEGDSEKRPSYEEIDVRIKRISVEGASTGEEVANSNVSLFDIFPKHIAEALRDGRTVEAEHKDCVTIFFCDIVGFTTISSTLDPRKVANMLDRLYTKFDELSGKHDIFKVETIGDAYMAVTNLVKEQPTDHVRRIAQFAIDAIEAANSTLIDTDDENQGCVNIRVGFHSGPVVADVVGSRNPRYCLFGDTVNTASRMESNSKANRIHCSKASADLLMLQAPDIPMRSRGLISVKGKGEMETYWVNDTPRAPKLKSAHLHKKLAEKRNKSITNGMKDDALIGALPEAPPSPTKSGSNGLLPNLKELSMKILPPSSPSKTNSSKFTSAYEVGQERALPNGNKNQEELLVDTATESTEYNTMVDKLNKHLLLL